MFGIFDKLTEFFKDMLLGGIKANLESMFLDINDKVGVIQLMLGRHQWVGKEKYITS